MPCRSYAWWARLLGETDALAVSLIPVDLMRGYVKQEAHTGPGVGYNP